MTPETGEKVGGEAQLHDAPKPSLRISAVCGSLRAKSTTKMALSLALKGASEFDVSTKLIELREYKLVFYGEVDETDYHRMSFDCVRSSRSRKGSSSEPRNTMGV